MVLLLGPKGFVLHGEGNNEQETLSGGDTKIDICEGIRVHTMRD
jgi:hypothetical protein